MSGHEPKAGATLAELIQSAYACDSEGRESDAVVFYDAAWKLEVELPANEATDRSRAATGASRSGPAARTATHIPARHRPGAGCPRRALRPAQRDERQVRPFRQCQARTCGRRTRRHRA